MDEATKEGVLASMAFRRVDAMRRRLLEDIVKVHFDATGELPSASDALSKFVVLWVEPTPQRVADMVAAKCVSAIGYHNSELGRAQDEIDKAEAADERVAALKRTGKIKDDGRYGEARANAETEDQVGRIEYAKAVAYELLDFAAGDPDNAPPALMAQRIIPQPVADFVEDLMQKAKG